MARPEGSWTRPAAAEAAVDGVEAKNEHWGSLLPSRPCRKGNRTESGGCAVACWRCIRENSECASSGMGATGRRTDGWRKDREDGSGGVTPYVVVVVGAGAIFESVSLLFVAVDLL